MTAHLAGPMVDIDCGLGLATVPAWSSVWNWATATSTRTGPRREPAARIRRAPAGHREKAAVLVESLPYIRRFLGKVVVVKYGGNVLTAKPGQDAVDEEEALASFAEDIVLMRSVGMLPVVVHGGGPQIGALMERVGKEVEFQDGFRVTDADTIDLVRMVLVGKVNRDIVRTINVHGALAVGLSGEDANLIKAEARSEALGFVGDVVGVDPTIVHQLLAQGLIPVVATIGTDASGQAFNINADAAAGALAAALNAEKLVFLTDVAGLRSVPDDPTTLLHRATADSSTPWCPRGRPPAG